MNGLGRVSKVDPWLVRHKGMDEHRGIKVVVDDGTEIS